MSVLMSGGLYHTHLIFIAMETNKGYIRRYGITYTLARSHASIRNTQQRNRNT